MSTVPVYLITLFLFTTLLAFVGFALAVRGQERHSEYRLCGSASSQQSRYRGSTFI